ncbi:MAG: DUF3784 domain-containing protein [Oscillospiraceae bacterium]|nr:DUF3784 domain-containing protein [Oscillospiraceae bacterium]
MIVLKIISLLLGLAFSLFGYFIFFHKKYSLINGFDNALKTGEKTETYAKRVGLIEFILGITLFIIGYILIILD